jgi:group I intron endonuclease
MIIYRAFNTVNSKSYIGQTRQTLEQRKQRHLYAAKKKSTLAFHLAIQKYGEQAFIWKILTTATSIEHLSKLEKKFIEEYRSFTNGYNMTTGGETYQITKLTRKSISEKLKGRPKSAAHRLAISIAKRGKTGWWKGRQRSKQNLENASKALKGKPAWNKNQTGIYSEAHLKHLSEIRQGVSNPMYGRKHTLLTCPHCETQVPKNVAKRWHFDNCRVVK